MNIYQFYLTVCCYLIMANAGFCQSTSQLVYINQGVLTYVPFSMQGQTNEVNKIPDFSYAGYKGGGVSLPTDIPIMAIVTPEEGDDTRSIQEAINLVETLEPDQQGFRGVVLVKAGHYSLENILVIRESGVVLRGEGQGLNGTVLHSNPRIDHSVITIFGTGGVTKDPESTQAIITEYVSVGSSSFDVVDASNYEVGDQIVVTRTPNQVWIDEIGMDQETLCQGASGCVGWTPDVYTIDHERVITGISGNRITVDIPIVDVIEENYGGGSITKVQLSRRVNQCGVENMRIQSFYDSDSDESHAWTAVRLHDAEHCWVKEVTGQYLAYSTVIIDDANFTTVQDCAYINPKSQVTGGRRYSFAIQEGIGNLFQRCYAKNGRHDFVTGSRVTGPNVFLDGLAETVNSDIGPHHRWATGTLFDNIRGGSVRVWNRGSSGTGHGWSGAQTMFWNIDSYSGEFRVDSPLGSMNWGVGCIGANQTGEGYWESWGDHVQPRSLYLQQLADRLGEVAVNNVTIPQQRTGEIDNLLVNWAGMGDFYDGGVTGSLPNISFLNPESMIDVSLWEGGDIELEAIDSDGTIQSVKLLINGEPIGTDYDTPYIFNEAYTDIQNLKEGIHYLQAIATDNDGNASVTRLRIIGGDPPQIEEEEEPVMEFTDILIFPNPAQRGELTIRMKKDGLYSLRIVDMQGKLVDEEEFEGLDYQYSCNLMAAGIYILEIKSESEIVFKGKVTAL